jgi:hypothetical protein
MLNQPRWNHLFYVGEQTHELHWAIDGPYNIGDKVGVSRGVRNTRSILLDNHWVATSTIGAIMLLGYINPRKPPPKLHVPSKGIFASNYVSIRTAGDYDQRPLIQNAGGHWEISYFDSSRLCMDRGFKDAYSAYQFLVERDKQLHGIYYWNFLDASREALEREEFESLFSNHKMIGLRTGETNGQI